MHYPVLKRNELLHSSFELPLFYTFDQLHEAVDMFLADHASLFASLGNQQYKYKAIILEAEHALNTPQKRAAYQSKVIQEMYLAWSGLTTKDFMHISREEGFFEALHATPTVRLENIFSTLLVQEPDFNQLALAYTDTAKELYDSSFSKDSSRAKLLHLSMVYDIATTPAYKKAYVDLVTAWFN